jgi:hypothetical protein
MWKLQWCIKTTGVSICNILEQQLHAEMQLNYKCKPKLDNFNPFSGRFIISSHIYKREFPLPPAGI